MIFIKKLEWDNWFSYGEENVLEFSSPILQIMGKNGSGKTSIPLILQEVFYGKNSKGKKKSTLPNRYMDKPILKAYAEFSVDNDDYTINLVRKASLKIKLTKNGEDISSHTTTGTYKTIESILGIDFKTFAQLTYQSSKDNLEFLTATDVNRKKFLISLFNLNKYLDIQEKFKTQATALSNERIKLDSTISTIEGWISRNGKTDFTLKEVQELPQVSDEDIDKLSEMKSSLANIKQINKEINKNNQLIELRDSLDTSILFEHMPKIDADEKQELISKGKSIKNTKVRNETLISSEEQKISKINNMPDTCHSCGQSIPLDLKESMLTDAETTRNNLVEETKILSEKLSELSDEVKKINSIEAKHKERSRIEGELTKLNSQINEDLDKEVLDSEELTNSINKLSQYINSINLESKRISEENSIASAHNTKIEVIKQQLEEYRDTLEELFVEMEEISDTVKKVDIIKRAFGTSGLLSYKLDFLVKDLEHEINSYLASLSNGKFQIAFKLENEKLNIDIIDEGIAVGIEELSDGERARINAATLLAIRRLMSAISSTKMNILFLDEIMGVLDEEGKEVLIDVLHSETDLNTLLVSHEYSHPLIPKVLVNKENRISRLEDG